MQIKFWYKIIYILQREREKKKNKFMKFFIPVKFCWLFGARRVI